MANDASPAGFLRDKDRRLAEACADMASGAVQGVSWLSQHRDQSLQRDALQKRLRRQAVEARRLANAASRPMSVGVFGASQMGKSFLIGKLITPPDRAAHVVFGQGQQAVRQNFLEQVNPSGGDETTGLVTRFSLRSEDSPPGFPVVLRLLREVDIVKILVNSFVLDCKGQYRLRQNDDDDSVDDRTPSPESLEALADATAKQAGSADQPGFAVEDVYELNDYLAKSLPDHLMTRDEYEGFWQVLEAMLPKLDGTGRVRLLSQLWAGLEEFSALYLQLKQALDALDHPERMYTSLEALADRSRGVLHVNTLRELDATTPTQQLRVVAPDGRQASFATCVITALTAELCVTLETAPWPFFSHTDLLDFPGARSREDKPVHGFLRKAGQTNARADCFLRGKVAVLFDNYAANLDLNVMLLCQGPENHEVKSLPVLVHDWIARTHGATPAQRQGKPIGLFYCLTKCDTLFVQRVGGEAPVNARLAKDFKPYGIWAEEWTPGKPYNNTFLIRNPGILDRGLFDYDPGQELTVPPEIGIAAEFDEYLSSSFRRMYDDEPLVIKHIADPQRKLDEVLALNDGGTTYLARLLAPVCDPDLKHAQIQPRALQTRDTIRQALAGYHDTGDIDARLKARLVRTGRLITRLSHRSDLIGPFIADFQIDESLMEAAYRHYRRNRAETPPADNPFATLFEADTTEPAPAASGGFGAVLIEWWARHLSAKVADSPWLARLDIDEEALGGFVEEILVGVERRNLAGHLEGRVDGFTSSAMTLDAASRRISIIATLALNDEVNFPGGRYSPDNAQRFARPTQAGNPAETLPEDPKSIDRLRLTYSFEWMGALKDVTASNASWGSGGRVNVQANADLGRILTLVDGDQI